MTRRLLAGALIVAATAVVPVAAHADTTKTVTVTSTVGFPSGWGTVPQVDFCPEHETQADTETHITGPGAPPLGKGSLEVTVPANAGVLLTESLPSSSPSELSSALLHSYAYPISGSDTAMTATADIILTIDDSHYYDLSAPLPSTTSTWEPLNVLTSNLNWAQWTAGDLTGTTIGSGTYADFLAGDHPATLSSYEIGFLNCGATTQRYAVDDITTGIDAAGTDTLTALNFEATPPTVLTAHFSDSSITKGRSVTPSVTATVAGDGTEDGIAVVLSAKPAGATGYHKVATETTNSHGTATAPPQRPTTNTTYRWTYAPLSGSEIVAGQSTPAIVRVAPRVTIAVPTHPVGAHKSVKVTGVASPKHGGAVVELWRTNGRHPKKLAHGVERSSGKFKLSRRVPAGVYHLYVTVAKTSTNAAGRSSRHKVTVR
jgi:hypothetical protein